MSDGWVSNREGDLFSLRLRLAIHESPSDGWFYLMICDEDGDIIEGEDAVAWENTLAKAKRTASLYKPTSQRRATLS